MAVNPIRDGFHAVTPYLMVAGVPRLLDFLAKAFGAQEAFRLQRPDGSIGHAEVRIGDSMVMLGEPMGPFGPMPTQIYLYVDDCDAVYRRALQAGGAMVMEPTTMPFSGERYGGVKDPAGNIWWVATHIEDVTPEECARRFAQWHQRHAPT
jgi:PhnB protein